jgi:opacity protein-like surface antigen
MLQATPTRRRLFYTATAVCFVLAAPRAAHAQAFISPTIGYNFGDETGCRSATDCRDKNWNWGGSFGALGSFVGFEVELTYQGHFTGDQPDRRSKVTTVMGNFMLAPRITIVQPYGLAGVGLIRTELEAGVNESENKIGWTVGGGVIVFLQKHIGLKGDVRYYRSFEASDLLNFDLGLDRSAIDFGRAGFGVIFKF